MLFGALALTVSTAVTSCKDYDDDIKGLQEQVDKITSASPVSTEDMNAAVDKASKELKDQLAKLEKLVNDPSSETSLTQQIADLQEALKTAVGENAKDLAGKLATAQNDLTALKKALGGDDYINGLKKKITDLETAKSTLQTLIDAEAAYQNNKDISGYKNTGFDAYVSQAILNAIDEKGSIALYVDKTVKTAVGTVLADVNAYLSENFEENSDLAAFVKKVNETLFSKEYKDQMDKLNLLLTAIDAAVGDGSTYADYAAVIKQIDDTKQQLATLQLPSGEGVTFNSAVTKIVEDKLSTVTSSIQSLEEKLQKEIDAIKGMIQSIVYIPESADRTVNFNTFYVKFGTNGNPEDWKSVANVNEVKVNFRVSPASAVAELIKGDEGKYSISTDYHQLTRATGTHFKIKKIEAISGEPNVIAVTLDASTADKSYAVALTVKDKAETTLNDITSDYFAAVKENLYIKEVGWESANAAVDNVAKNASIDYKATGSYYKMTVHSEINGSGDVQNAVLAKTKPEEYGISVDNLFKVAFTVDGAGAGSFTLDATTGKLTGNNDGTAGATCTVHSTVTAMLPGTSTTKVFAAVDYAQVKLESKLAAQDIALANPDAPLVWHSTEQKIPLNATTIDALKTALGSIANFSTCTFTRVLPVTGAGVPDIKFGKDASAGNNLVLIVPAGATYTGKVTTKISVNNINVELSTDIAIDYPAEDDYTLTKSTNAWSESNAVLNLKETGSSPITAITAERDLTELFSNYTTLSSSLTAIGGAFKFSVVGDAINGVSLDATSGALSVANTYLGAKTGFSVKVEAVCDTKVISTVTVPVVFNTAKMNGTFGYATGEVDNDKLVYDVSSLEKRTAGVDVTTALVWKDAAGTPRQLWPSTGASDAYQGNDGAALYGFKVTFELVAGNDANANFNLDAASGKLTLKAPSASQNTKEMTVKVKAIPSSPWGEVEPKIVTVTVATWGL